jgi:hypothetical protein
MIDLHIVEDGPSRRKIGGKLDVSIIQVCRIIRKLVLNANFPESMDNSAVMRRL